MKSYIIHILSAFMSILLILLTVYFVDGKKTRRFLYYYPNGLIINADSSNSHMIGVNLYEDNIPRINTNLSKEHSPENIARMKFNTMVDFLPFIIAMLIFINTASWFLFRHGDFYLFFFFAVIATLIYSNFLILAFDEFYFLYYFSIFTAGFLIFHLASRLKGRDIPIRWIIPEIAFALILAFIGFQEKANSEIFTKLSMLAVWFINFSSIGCLGVLVYDLIKYKATKDVILKKSTLFLSIFLVTLLPYLTFYFDLLSVFKILKEVIYISFITFPFLFIYGTYRYSFIPEQVLFSSSFTVLYSILSVIGLYVGFYILFYSISENFLSRNLWLYNIIFLILATYLGVSFRNRLSVIINNQTYGRDKKLKTTLDEIVTQITNPVSIRKVTRSLVKKVTQALNVQKIVILIPGDRFSVNTGEMNIHMIRTSPNSELWNYFSNQKEITITSALKYGSGAREAVYAFLTDLNIQLAYPMSGYGEDGEVSAVFLVGEKTNPGNFSLGELNFIKECSRFTDLLLHNYQLLIADVEKKKIEKRFKAARILETTINPQFDEKPIIDNVEIGYLSNPAVGISGDYIDFLKIDNKKLLVFLGDVSGHGLGSGYLVSAVKALVRDQVNSGIELSKIITNINKFLIERYAGSEFMTLVAGMYFSDTGVFEYVNAGHLSPIIVRGDGTLETFRSGHRILGVIPTVFTKDKIYLNPGDRLFLYSDGVTETFSPSEEIYGEERLKKFLINNHDLNAKELLRAIEKELDDFRKHNDLSDDVSYIALRRML